MPLLRMMCFFSSRIVSTSNVLLRTIDLASTFSASTQVRPSAASTMRSRPSVALDHRLRRRRQLGSDLARDDAVDLGAVRQVPVDDRRDPPSRARAGSSVTGESRTHVLLRLRAARARGRAACAPPRAPRRRRGSRAARTAPRPSLRSDVIERLDRILHVARALPVRDGLEARA